LTSTIRVGIVEDHRLVLDALCKLVESHYEVVGTASDGREAVLLANAKKPEILLMDITLPGLNGLDAARQIKQSNPDIKLIFVTVHMHQAYAKEAFDAGASGYVLKQAPSSELLEAIRSVSEGKFFVSSILAEKFRVPQLTSEASGLNLFSSLTSRQREVLQMVAEGKSRKEIAETLHVSIKTVEFHKNQLKRALNLQTTADLIRYSLELGFIPE
jgi:DNA-binding NarL/FixJ family response regulator